jgi:hypothetical protein
LQFPSPNNCCRHWRQQNHGLWVPEQTQNAPQNRFLREQKSPLNQRVAMLYREISWEEGLITGTFGTEIKGRPFQRVGYQQLSR